MLQAIAATRTRTGLTVEAHLDTGDYPTGIAISKDRFAALPLVKHETHRQWKYTLLPEPTEPTTPPVSSEAHGVAERRRSLLARLADPRLTGLSRAPLLAEAGLLPPRPTPATAPPPISSLQHEAKTHRQVDSLRLQWVWHRAQPRLLLPLQPTPSPATARAPRRRRTAVTSANSPSTPITAAFPALDSSMSAVRLAP